MLPPFSLAVGFAATSPIGEAFARAVLRQGYCPKEHLIHRFAVPLPPLGKAFVNRTFGGMPQFYVKGIPARVRRETSPRPTDKTRPSSASSHASQAAYHEPEGFHITNFAEIPYHARRAISRTHRVPYHGGSKPPPYGHNPTFTNFAFCIFATHG